MKINISIFRFAFSNLSMLFRYLDINCHTGVMMCSPSIFDEHNLKTKDMFKKIEEKFNSTVTILRDLFNKSNKVLLFQKQFMIGL